MLFLTCNSAFQKLQWDETNDDLDPDVHEKIPHSFDVLWMTMNASVAVWHVFGRVPACAHLNLDCRLNILDDFSTNRYT